MQMKTKSIKLVLIITLMLANLPCNASARTKKEKALEVYQKFLKKYESEFIAQEFDWDTVNKENYKYCSYFMTEDLDGDKIPELITMHPDAYKSDDIYVYTYKKGKVTRLTKQGITCSSQTGGYSYVYLCSQKHLHSYYFYGILAETDTAYKLNQNGKVSKYLDYEESYVTNNITCKKNSKKISVKKYNAIKKKCKELDTTWKENNSTERSKMY